jgi:hypothetical protein
MRSLWRYVICGAICTLVLTALMFSPVGQSLAAVAFWLLFPAVWLTNATIAPLITTSDTGLEHLITVVLTSSLLNILFYAAIFFALTKLTPSFRRTKFSQNQPSE